MSEFVKMTKEGAVIEVAPQSVEPHQALGWKILEAPQPEATESKAAEKKAKAESKAAEKKE